MAYLGGLLERGARIDHRDAFGGADALLLAAENGLERVVERILERGPAPQARLFNEKSALDVAVERGHVGIVRRLLAAGFPTNQAATPLANANGWTASKGLQAAPTGPSPDTRGCSQ